MNVYSHSGDASAVIAALPIIKVEGGGDLVLYPAPVASDKMTRTLADSLLPLLEAQSYIQSVEWADGPIGVDLDRWNGPNVNTLNLSDAMASWRGLPLYPREQPWLTVP